MEAPWLGRHVIFIKETERWYFKGNNLSYKLRSDLENQIGQF